MPPCAVFLPKPSQISFAESMSQLRTWFDHKKIQPTWFRLREGKQTGFEINFQSEAEASAFDVGFAWQAPAAQTAGSGLFDRQATTEPSARPASG